MTHCRIGIIPGMGLKKSVLFLENICKSKSILKFFSLTDPKMYDNTIRGYSFYVKRFFFLKSLNTTTHFR